LRPNWGERVPSAPHSKAIIVSASAVGFVSTSNPRKGGFDTAIGPRDALCPFPKPFIDGKFLTNRQA
jgi:hypothetical protein